MSMICGSKNSTYWTDNPSIGHIPIRIQGKNFETFYIVDVACHIYLYLVWRRSSIDTCKTISSDKASIDILDTF